MMTKLRRLALRVLALLFSERLAQRMAHFLSRKLVAQVRGEATDEFLETLLDSMDAALCLLPSYRQNIADFSATYVFTTEDGEVASTARFAGGDMDVGEHADSDYTTRIRFKDAAALRRFLFSDHQDILQSILANEVEVDGNVNYIYKLGFMARDLERRLGLAA